MVEFVGELGVDAGGLTRDMFSAFWEEAYCRFFDGGSLLSPVIHPGSDLASLPIVGRILSHGFLVAGFLPVRIAFPTLASILLGSTITLPDSLLMTTFEDSISCHEAATVRDALSVKGERFSSTLNSKLITIFSRFGCREMPQPGKIRETIARIAQYEFQCKPLAGINAIRSGINSDHLSFWKQFSIDSLHSLVIAVTAHPAKVIDSLCSEPASHCEERVFMYLQQFIGQMNQNMLRRFLRFVTGSSVFSAHLITIIYNNSSGLSRCPIAHTCTYTLELPASYETYGIFVAEFESVLNDSQYAWMIDSA